MTVNWPPLDVHAHIDPSIDANTLLNLRAVIFAANRSIEESAQALERRPHDLLAVWGAGVHPGLKSALENYSPSAFAALLERTPYVGEVGLDAKVKSRLPLQREVLSSILQQLQTRPRITSIHSYGATNEVLDQLTETPILGAVLHWWLGDRNATLRAIELGAYFSINASSVRRSETLDVIPLERLLLETDHPDGNRYGRGPRQPGNIADVETALAARYGITTQAIRERAWRNLAELVEATATLDMLPSRVRGIVSSA
ncbi:TatD family hydrolase [Luethyella okanaganae]|uniref:TatD family hydrolase n=1 Tax=Luethyella okanaganae TaxID=69372 RepID=A0ABW1VG01_9MICO